MFWQQKRCFASTEVEHIRKSEVALFINFKCDLKQRNRKKHNFRYESPAHNLITQQGLYGTKQQISIQQQAPRRESNARN